jgi:hypothetical protein
LLPSSRVVAREFHFVGRDEAEPFVECVQDKAIETLFARPGDDVLDQKRGASPPPFRFSENIQDDGVTAFGNSSVAIWTRLGCRKMCRSCTPAPPMIVPNKSIRPAATVFWSLWYFPSRHSRSSQ